MTTAVEGQISAATVSTVQAASASNAASDSAASDSAASDSETSSTSTSSLDTPAVAPPRDFAAEARQIVRNFENARRSGETYQRFEPTVTTETNAAGETITVPQDPRDTVRDIVREFENSQRDRERTAQRPESPAQRVLSRERQSSPEARPRINLLAAAQVNALTLGSLANTLNIAQSNASSFYEDFRASNRASSSQSPFSRRI